MPTLNLEIKELEIKYGKEKFKISFPTALQMTKIIELEQAEKPILSEITKSKIDLFMELGMPKEVADKMTGEHILAIFESFIDEAESKKK